MLERYVIVGLCAVLALAMAACAQPADPAPTAEEAKALADGNRRFALDLLGAAGETEKNGVLCPHSVTTALSMVYAGARGETKAEMAAVLRDPTDDVHALLCALENGLAEATKGDETPALTTANRVWLDMRERLLASYEALLDRWYEAGVETVDTTAPEETANAINAWVAEKTRDRIEDLLSPDDVEDAALILTNAVWFKGKWAEPFDKDNTEDAPFALLGGETVSVPMMRQKMSASVAIGEQYEAFELPYQGDASHGGGLVIIAGVRPFIA